MLLNVWSFNKKKKKKKISATALSEDFHVPKVLMSG